ncbi:MAG: heavy-metal-associated domain-containing protein [Leptospirales bacterium]
MPPDPLPPLKRGGVRSTVFKVTGLTCNHCVMAVTRAIEKVPGVTKVAVSLERGEISVEGPPSRVLRSGATRSRSSHCSTLINIKGGNPLFRQW